MAENKTNGIWTDDDVVEFDGVFYRGGASVQRLTPNAQHTAVYVLDEKVAAEYARTQRCKTEPDSYVGKYQAKQKLRLVKVRVEIIQALVARARKDYPRAPATDDDIPLRSATSVLKELCKVVPPNDPLHDLLGRARAQPISGYMSPEQSEERDRALWSAIMKQCYESDKNWTAEQCHSVRRIVTNAPAYVPPLALQFAFPTVGGKTLSRRSLREMDANIIQWLNGTFNKETSQVDGFLIPSLPNLGAHLNNGPKMTQVELLLFGSRVHNKLTCVIEKQSPD